MKGSSMLSKYKIVLVSVLALFAFATAVSSAVAAPEWLVNGTKTTSASLFTIANAAALSAGNSLTWKGGSADVTCTAVEFQSAFLKGTKENGAQHAVFTGCTVAKPTTCKLASSTIVTGEVRSELLTVEPAEVTFKPLNGTVFATFEMINNGTETCGLGNHKLYEVSGHLNATVVEPTHDTVLKEVTANTGAGELTFANGEEMELKGTISLKLSNGLLWGVS
jgi:hypothetical protein